MVKTCHSMLMKTPDYKIEFPRFDELDLPIPDGFEDHSWHNDACPSFAMKLSDSNYLRLWVDYKDKKDSDFADVQDDRYFRFGLVLYSADMEWIRDLSHTNDFADILKGIEDYRASHA
jgi:hypothetical protein